MYSVSSDRIPVSDIFFLLKEIIHYILVSDDQTLNWMNSYATHVDILHIINS